MINNEPENKNFGYVAVNIVQANNVGSRAASDVFENGTSDENYAQKGLFFIFNTGANPTLVNQPQLVDLSDAGQTGTAPEVEAVYNAVLVIDGVEERPSSDIQIVCVLNAPATLASGVTVGMTTIDDLSKLVGNYSAHERGTFIMSNSVYRETADGVKILGAEVKNEQIKENANLALADPVNVYVERVVAKIRAKLNPDGFTNSGATIIVDGEKKELDIDVKGITLANVVENQAYLLKNIEGFGTTSDEYSKWVWDKNNKRSYWETMPAAEISYVNKIYNNLPSFNTGASSDKPILEEYVLPNTSSQKTSVLVTAQLKEKGKTYEEGKGFEFVYLRGYYCTPDNAKDLIANYVANGGYWKKTADNKYEQLAGSDFEWKNKNDLAKLGVTLPYDLKSYEQVARVKGTLDIYTRNASGDYVLSSVDAVNEHIAGTATSHPYVARVYTDGMCYYHVNIDQTPVAQAQIVDPTQKPKNNTFEGIVRNHIYELTLNSITGIGTPVFNPDEVIIPDKPVDENLYFLSARINVLAWRVVKQGIDFTGKNQ